VVRRSIVLRQFPSCETGGAGRLVQVEEDSKLSFSYGPEHLFAVLFLVHNVGLWGGIPDLSI
jgi:hypothetical protein